MVVLLKGGICLISRYGGCATRGFPPSQARNSRLRRLGFSPSLRSIRAAPHAYAFRVITLRIEHTAGSTTPPTSGRPGSAYSGSWALPIRFGVCRPYAPALRASWSRCGGCATRGFPTTRAGLGLLSGPTLALAPVHPRCSARLRASYSWLAELMICTKSAGFRLAPPIRPPSTSG